jgi:hypothetical protein
MTDTELSTINKKEFLEKMTVEEFLKEQFNLKIAELKRYTQQKIDQFKEESQRVRALLESLIQESQTASSSSKEVQS